ncbi:hypothetical protein TNCV_1171251 [Trichonephila clavipes]|nr:hypothetical protein TNCV_1171251 [Trichonephila clavipes]
MAQQSMRAKANYAHFGMRDLGRRELYDGCLKGFGDLTQLGLTKQLHQVTKTQWRNEECKAPSPLKSQVLGPKPEYVLSGSQALGPLELAPSKMWGLQRSTRGLFATDLVSFSHGQVKRTTPELAPLSPNYHTTPKTFELTTDLMCIAGLQYGTGLQLRTRQPRSRYLDH